MEGNYQLEVFGTEVQGPFRLIVAVALVAVAGGVTAAALTWHHAPAVGGEFWVYIRILLSAVMFIVGAWVMQVLNALGVLLYITRE